MCFEINQYSVNLKVSKRTYKKETEVKRTEKTYLSWDEVPILVNIKEAAVILGCSEITVKRKLESGAIKGCKEICGWRISKEYLKSIFAA